MTTLGTKHILIALSAFTSVRYLLTTRQLWELLWVIETHSHRKTRVKKGETYSLCFFNMKLPKTNLPLNTTNPTFISLYSYDE